MLEYYHRAEDRGAGRGDRSHDHEARQQARKEKLALADEIIGKLLDMGIVLEDTREGVKWKSITLKDFLAYYKKTMRLEPVDAGSYSPLVLAYIGDAVYEVMIRARVINREVCR